MNLPLRIRNGRNHSGASEHNCIVILRGYPSAQWLNELGSQCNIDPEFLHRHLSFLVRGAEKQQHMSFVLPSSQRTIFQMPLTSVGMQAHADHNVSATRARTSANMETYLHNLRVGKGWKCGDSIVRAFTVHDEQLFSIEQKVTVYVSRIDKMSEKWIVIMWFDCGKDLSQSPAGPWFEPSSSGLHTYFHPTILFKPNIAFKDHQIVDSSHTTTGGPNAVHQSASLLSTCYGRSLHSATMIRDPFYVLTELFTFVSASELALLNAISARLGELNKDTDLLDMDPGAISRAQAHLLQYRRVLEEQAHKTAETLTFIRNRDRLEWPPQSSKGAHASARAEQDFEYLASRNALLQSRCERALTTIMNNATISEAREGIALSARVFKLTLLASTFVPLSFSTSIFGMNFLQFEDDQVSRGYWVWALVTVPIMSVSGAILLWDAAKVRRKFKNAWSAVFGD
ncbi:hypothetical protein V8F06_011589 [Rhypophila decipiens]